MLHVETVHYTQNTVDFDELNVHLRLLKEQGTL